MNDSEDVLLSKCNDTKCFFMDNGKCRKEITQICICDKPIPEYVNKKNKVIGICVNCHHFIIYANKSWYHYYRSYDCSSGYFGSVCVAPIGLSEVVSKKNLLYEKVKK